MDELRDHGDEVSTPYLKKYEEFREFQTARSTSSATAARAGKRVRSCAAGEYGPATLLLDLFAIHE